MEVVELDRKYPCEIVHSKDIEEEMSSFLTEELNQPNKQDIIIFN